MKLVIALVSCLAHIADSSDFITPADRKGASGTGVPAKLISEDEAGKPLEPGDFIRGEQALAGDFYRRSEDPTASDGTHFEGDIDLRGLPVESFVDVVTDDSPYKLVGDIAHNAIKGQYFIWPDARIPYLIHKTFNAFERGKIAAAMAEYNKHTCIRWVPKARNDRNYVFIIRGKGCYSTIGKAGGRQELSLGKGCIKKGIIIHEMMHAAGFWHEQSRNDRDDYVTIMWDNVQDWHRGNFKKLSLKQIDHLGTSYDYGSIMHYGRDFFSLNGRDTIVPKGNNKIGQRNGFSKTDAYKLKKLYKCRGTTGKRIITGPVIIGPSPGPAPTSVCKDKNFHCDMWAEFNLCGIDTNFMQRECKKSCGGCGKTRKPSVCKDIHDWCGFWLDVGECTNAGFKDFMKKNCPKSCGLC